MKAKINFTTFLFATLAILGTACSCNDGSDKDKSIDESKKIENTSWTPVHTNFHNADNVVVNKTEENSLVLTKIKEFQGLEYTETTNTNTQDWFWDLCKIEKHGCDSVLTASFSSEKCSFHVKVSRSRAKAKFTKTEKLYKFTEGSFFVRIGYSSNYEGVTVNKYGVYRADGSLFIPLDGNGSVVYETDYIYTDKQLFDEDIEEYTIPANYQISNNQITFTFDNKEGKKETFTGTLSQDGKNITFAHNPIVNSVTLLKR